MFYTNIISWNNMKIYLYSTIKIINFNPDIYWYRENKNDYKSNFIQYLLHKCFNLAFCFVPIPFQCMFKSGEFTIELPY